MSRKILVENLPTEKINGKNRMFCIVECPECTKQRKVRTDSYKTKETTLCGSCVQRTRPTKNPKELFNPRKYYRSLTGKASYIYTTQLKKSEERDYSLPSYSREELIDYLLNNQTYLDLFKDWENSGFKKELAPSVDRIDDYKSYSFENIQIVTWGYNNEKYSQDTLSGKSVKTCKAVDQLDLEGNFIKRFYSQQEAGRQLKIDSSKISAVCIGKSVKKGTRTSIPKTANGFKWRFSELPNSNKESL